MDLQMNLNTDFVKWLDADGHIFEKKQTWIPIRITKQ